MDDPENTTPNSATEVLSQLRAELEGKSIGSLEEARALTADFMHRQSAAPIEDFHGLTSGQMHQMLHFPFDLPDLVTFADAPESSLGAPIMRLVGQIIEAVGEKGLKLTVKGNLPRNFVRSAALEYWGEEPPRLQPKPGDLRFEEDFRELHFARLVAGLAGLTRKQHGKLIPTRKALSAKGNLARLYPHLLEVFATRYNWAYLTGYGGMSIVQESFLYTIFLLQRFGAEWRETTFYEDAFLHAFPTAVVGIEPDSSWTAAKKVQNGYQFLALERFAVFMGMAEQKVLGKDRYFDKVAIRKLPLADEAVRFTA